VRFLADENMPGAVLQALTSAGHDVEWVRLNAPGMVDAEVLAWAIQEDRVLLTFDKDFGDIARAQQRSDAWGVILFRIPMPNIAEVGPAITAIIGSRDDWIGHFSVVEPGCVRMRAIAASPIESP
jgi:hypothetical protein